MNFIFSSVDSTIKQQPPWEFPSDYLIAIGMWMLVIIIVLGIVFGKDEDEIE